MTEPLWTVELGDCLEILRRLPDACIDAIVTDPPAGIAFMGQAWDTPGAWRAPITKPGFTDGAERVAQPTIGSSRNPVCRACHKHQRGNERCVCAMPQWDQGDARAAERDAFVGFMTAVMTECRRVLKPGGHALVWAIPRTSHWTAMALELAGFEIRDCLTHLFGSGFPKSLDVSKEIDKAHGVWRGRCGAVTIESQPSKGTEYERHEKGPPVTPSAATWSGWGTALKPASEHWWLARKPLTGTVTRNVLEHGTGALNIDGCRIEHANAADLAHHESMVTRLKEKGGTLANSWKNSSDLSGANDVSRLGRWPANVVLSHAEDCEQLGEDVWQCTQDCPISMLDAQSGDRPGMSGGGKHRAEYAGGMFGAIDSEHTARCDTGGASRFFYCAKAATREREAGCEHLPKFSAGDLTQREDGSAGLNSPRAGAGRTSAGRSNHHPTVKSIALMRWLCRLVTPPGGVILDPFCGSGSTGCAAVLEGFVFCGIDMEVAYVDIARARIAHWERKR